MIRHEVEQDFKVPLRLLPESVVELEELELLRAA